jgi:hypothetical protein
MLRSKHFQASLPEYASYRSYLYLDPSPRGSGILLGFFLSLVTFWLSAAYISRTIFPASFLLLSDSLSFLYLSVFRLQACLFVPVPTIMSPYVTYVYSSLSICPGCPSFACVYLYLYFRRSVCLLVSMYACLPIRLLSVLLLLLIFLSI